MRPRVCLYCDGEGHSAAGGACGFCVDGFPLDSGEDWEHSWAQLDEHVRGMSEHFRALGEAANEAVRVLCRFLIASPSTPPYKRNTHRYGR